MPLDRELDIAKQQRRSLLGNEETPEKKPSGSMVERVSHQRSYRKTMDAGNKLQDEYREKHGMDQFNRPKSRTAPRTTRR